MDAYIRVVITCVLLLGVVHASSVAPREEEECGPEVELSPGVKVRGICEIVTDGECNCFTENRCPNAAQECMQGGVDFYCCCYRLAQPPDICYDGSKEQLLTGNGYNVTTQQQPEISNDNTIGATTHETLLHDSLHLANTQDQAHEGQGQPTRISHRRTRLHRRPAIASPVKRIFHPVKSNAVAAKYSKTHHTIFHRK